jgi:hypothetical protein
MDKKLAELNLERTNHDDGIWLWCDKHGRVESVGSTPSVYEVVVAATAHLNDSHRRG